MAAQHSALDRKRVPLWHRIEVVLRHQITTGEYRIGDALPSEPALAAQFGVSRMTVREAIRSLMTDGLVRQVQGRGTFVLGGRNAESSAGYVTGLVEDVRFNEAFPAASPDPTHRVPHCSHIELITVEPPLGVRAQLELTAPTVVRAERVLIADGPGGVESLGYVIDYLPHEFGDRITEQDLARAWLTELLPELGVRVVEAQQTIQATLADVVIGEKLGIQFGAPLMYVERVYYGEQQRPLYVAKVWHRGDRFRYRAVFKFDAADAHAELK